MATTTIKANPIWEEGAAPTALTTYINFPTGDWTEINILIKAEEGYGNASYYFIRNAIEYIQSLSSNTRFSVRGTDSTIAEIIIAGRGSNAGKWAITRVKKSDGTDVNFTAKLFYR